MSGKMFFQIVLLIIIAAIVMSAAKYAMICAKTGEWKMPGPLHQQMMKK